MPLATSQRPVNTARLSSLLRANEGFRPGIYKDTVGKRTVGVGFNIDDPAIAKHISPDILSGRRQMAEPEAMQILEQRLLPIAMADAARYVGEDRFSQLDPVRQAVFVDLAYNLGAGKLNKFVKLKAALDRGDFNTAAFELLNSNLARQLPHRTRRNANLLRTGGRVEAEP